MSASAPPPGNRPPSGAPYTAPPPGGPAGPPARPPLRRRRDGKLLGGVLAGIADHLGLDVVVARILFVVLMLMTQGAFILGYILGWIFIPEETDEEAARQRPPRRDDLGGRDPLFWVGVGTLILAVLMLFGGPFNGPGLFRFGGDRSILVPLVLIAFGVALWRVTDRPVSPPASHPGMPPPEPTMSDHHPAASDTVRIDEPTSPSRDTQVADPPGWGAPPPPAVPPTAHGGDGRDWTPPPLPEPRGVLTRIVLGLAALTVGVLWLLDVSDVTALGPGRIMSAALLVIGVGLLVGTVVGRGRGLIAAGVLLLPVVMVLQVLEPLPVNVFSGDGQAVGSSVVTPLDEADLQDTYQVGAGELRLDLREIDFTQDHQVSAQVGLGEVTVVVPDDVSVELIGRVGAGELWLLDRRTDGVGLERTVVDDVAGSDARLVVEVNVGFGEGRVERTGAGAVGLEDGTAGTSGDATSDTGDATANTGDAGPNPGDATNPDEPETP